MVWAVHSELEVSFVISNLITSALKGRDLENKTMIPSTQILGPRLTSWKHVHPSCFDLMGSPGSFALWVISCWQAQSCHLGCRLTSQEQCSLQTIKLCPCSSLPFPGFLCHLWRCPEDYVTWGWLFAEAGELLIRDKCCNDSPEVSNGSV